jgi:hypothetical protein
MRAYWDAAIAVGFLPTSGDLNRAAGKDRSYRLGKEYAREWKGELSREEIAALQQVPRGWEPGPGWDRPAKSAGGRA